VTDTSHRDYLVGQQQVITEAERQRPFMLLRPRIYPDGNKWCALYGEDLQCGVAGLGDTPEEAARDFDKNWGEQTVGGR